MKRTRNLPSNPSAWRDPEVLEFLYVELGWTRGDIVDHFEALGNDTITEARVKRRLTDNEIQCGNSRPPSTGTGAVLWQMDSDAVGGDA
jgi:hypothetical protein